MFMGMKISAFTIVLIFSLSFSESSAQTVEKQIHDRGQLWFGYLNQARLNNKFGVWFDIHYRMTDHFVDRPFQFLVRTAVTYFIKENLRVNVGYALAEHFPPVGLKTARTEHRPWQQISWTQKYPALTTVQALRLEQRFNERIADDVKREGYNYHFRLRYNLSFLIPLRGKEIALRTPFLVISDEILLNLGEIITYNTFDQNRFFTGMGYQFTPKVSVQAGYMYVFQQQASGNNYFSTHAIRLFVFHSLDFRNRDKLK